MKIQIASPIISKNAKKYVSEAINSGWVSSKGPNIEKFERAFSKRIGLKHGVATNSGTSAIHLALAALGIGKGDEVILPASTMIASVLPVIYQGATPVLVDSEYPSGNIDPDKIETKITKNTKAIIIVHLYGHVANMEKIIKIAKRYKLKIIEDTAEATGSEYKLYGKWVNAGSMGDISCFSFYANKIITTGEGGMAATNNKTLALKMKSLSNLDRTSGTHFLHKSVGFAYRMSSLQASLGLAQLEIIDKIIAKKRYIAAQYIKYLSNINSITLSHEQENVRCDYWLFYILLGDKMEVSVNQLASELLQKGVETRTFHVPLHKQPALIKLGLFKNEKYPVAEDLFNRGLCLPSGPLFTNKEIKYVCDTIKANLVAGYLK